MVSQQPGAVASDLRELSTDVIATLGGTFTSLLTVGANMLVIHHMQRDFLSASAWFVIPIGAMAGGVGAASGYYVAARITQSMPTKQLKWNMLLVAASTWALAKWLPYVIMTLEDGTALSDVVTFWDYFRTSTESARLRLDSTATTRELGGMGYVREVLQLLGFMFGGILVFDRLRKTEACQKCRRYAQTEKLLKNETPEVFARVLQAAGVSVPYQVENLDASASANKDVRLMLIACRCPKCAAEWLRTSVIVPNRDPKKLGAQPVEPAQAAALRQHAASKPPGPRAEASRS